LDNQPPPKAVKSSLFWGDMVPGVVIIAVHYIGTVKEIPDVHVTITPLHPQLEIVH